MMVGHLQKRKRTIQLNSKDRPERFRSWTQKIDNPSSNSVLIDLSSSPVSDISNLTKAKLDDQVDSLFASIQRLVEMDGASRKEAVSYVCSSVLFRQIQVVDASVIKELVGSYLNQKVKGLQSELNVKLKEVQALKKQSKAQKQFSQLRLRSNSIFLPPRAGQQVHQLYCQANMLKFQDFHQLYQNIHRASHPIQLKVNTKQISLRNTLAKRFKQPLSELIAPFLSGLSQQEQQQFNCILRRQFQCLRPCCKWNKEEQQKEQKCKKKVQGQMSGKSVSKQKQSIYQTRKFSQYCTRYCSKNFNLSKVVSLSHTRSEQMDRIYTKFKHKQKLRQHQHHRNLSQGLI